MQNAVPSLSEESRERKRKFIRSVGLFFFLIGGYFVITTFFELNNFITGHVVSTGREGDIFSIVGLVVQVIGVFFFIASR